MSLEWINAGPNGEDYRKEQLLHVPKGVSASRTEGRLAFVVAAVILAAGIIALQHYQVSASLMISVTIALATMCLVGVLNLRTMTLEADIIYLSGAIEWFGNKHLEQLIDLKK